MRSDRNAIPPMGQGLAVIAALAAIALMMLIGIGGYMVSMRMQAHRVAVAHIDDRVAMARRQVRQLEYELEYRSRFTQLDHWREPLGLAPIGIDQRAADPRDLASLVARQRTAVAATRVDAVPRRASYTPDARQQMDSLIADIAK
jgi:hypothetical protein